MLNVSAGVLAAIAIGFALGEYVFRQRGSGGARRASATLSVLTGVFWLSAGVFAILGGFHIVGIGVIVLFWFIVRGNYREATDGKGLRARLAG